jgi:hypothetical protein
MAAIVGVSPGKEDSPTGPVERENRRKLCVASPPTVLGRGRKKAALSPQVYQFGHGDNLHPIANA